MRTVNRYMPEHTNREKLNRERCNTPGSIYRLDLSCNRISTYNQEYAKPEDYKFGNVFAFRSEAEKALNEIPKLYALFRKSDGKIGETVYMIMDNGNISELKREDMREINKKNNNMGPDEWTFEQYVRQWFDSGNCFDSLFKASAARDRIADMFEIVKKSK